MCMDKRGLFEVQGFAALFELWTEFWDPNWAVSEFCCLSILDPLAHGAIFGSSLKLARTRHFTSRRI